MKINKWWLAAIIGIPLIVWAIGVYLDVIEVTTNVATPLTKFVLDFWFVTGICFLIVWLAKRKKS